ncbi:RagB/SusD family nutrient uptake outer membrane protein [Mucilaginibacter sp. BT774]|uniref:RagB/SusD family nutrient uptake outer membrane protein n=1 Tax=Mucilaginibacter sp. BT774 TaxID=3062276 RepID=UPI0026775AD8|nr:RagB/SusD family nutrient uptake outer membrane protein [Mucilaginibacter sp. BT774]MDO3628248.1 RagB/SusD family nutrient uptake outer membrane protein [Mucilaginibacter sp. BT774]
MKNKYYLYMIVLAIMAFASCKKDSFLNRYPLSDVSPQNFFKDETDLQLYCNQYYANLPIQGFVDMDDNSDDKANASMNQFLAGTYTVPTTGGGWDFGFIRTCNYFLANYSKANTTTDIKNIYVGETLFFRANDYWGKVKRFGDVPYINRYITDTSKSALYGTRMPHKQVMDSVLKDINFAVDHLPESAADGRVNKYIALALKARVCLWEGTYRKYFGAGDETPYLQAASDAAEQIMNSGQYNIYTTGHPQTDYYNLFIQDELQVNPEAIMPMRYLTTVLTNNFDRQLGEAGDGYSKDFVRSYLCSDGLPTSLSPLYKGDDTPDDEATNRDPRYKQEIATRGFDFLNGDIITLPRIGTSVTSTGYQPIKGRSSSIAAWNADQSTYDVFIFRYAETLLIEAEATAELGTCTQGILDATINKLRDRVGMPHMIITSLVKDPKSDFPNIPVLIDEIRRERRVELASEGFRSDDLHRWHAGTLINNPETVLGMKLTPALRAQYPPDQVGSIVTDANSYIEVYPGSARTWDDKLYLYPIPTQELTLNPNLKQNPGW